MRRSVTALLRFAQVIPWLVRAAVTRRKDVRGGGKRILMLTISAIDVDPRITKVTRTLAEQGYAVDVLAPSVAEPWEREVAPGVCYIGVPRVWLWRLFVVYQDEFRRVGLRRQFDYVHANDLTSLTVAWVLARIRRVPLIYDAHELWTENVQPSRDGWAPMSRTTRLLASAWERLLLRSVDVLTTVSPSIAAELDRRSPSALHPLLLPNYPSLRLSGRLNGASWRSELGLADDRFVTLYLGGVNPLRNIETVIRAHRHLPEEHVFVVRGPGIEAYEDEYRALARAEGLDDRVLLLPPVGMDDVIGAANGADCGIVMLRNICKNFYFFFPNKLFEYSLAGIPVAVSDFPDVRSFVVGERCGVTFDPDSPQSIADALRWLGEHRSEAQAMGARGRESVLRERNWEAAAQGLVAAYAGLAAPAQ
jgi:glycosyltransferase involved in cell wall biosynthesis